MRPLIEAMRADAHEVEVTARDFAQTLELCERLGIDHTAIGRHRGGRLASKGLGRCPERGPSCAGRVAGISTWRWDTGRTT
jgi:predicted glycosyltransferase